MTSTVQLMMSATDVETWTTTDNITNTDIEFNVHEYLQQHLGYRHGSTVESVSLTVVYLLILLTGVIGNVVTAIVIVRNSYMHTATNCYLFSLAISDTFQLVLGTLSLCFYFSTASIFQFEIIVTRGEGKEVREAKLAPRPSFPNHQN